MIWAKRKYVFKKTEQLNICWRPLVSRWWNGTQRRELTIDQCLDLEPGGWKHPTHLLEWQRKLSDCAYLFPSWSRVHVKWKSFRRQPFQVSQTSWSLWRGEEHERKKWHELWFHLHFPEKMQLSWGWQRCFCISEPSLGSSQESCIFLTIWEQWRDGWSIGN